MSPNIIYSTIDEKGYNEGIAFIMTANASVIEAHLYGGIIIFSKSLKLNAEQILQSLSNGDAREVTFRDAAVKLDLAQPALIAHTFSAAMAAAPSKPGKISLPKIFKLIRLISNLKKTDKDQGIKVAETMARQFVDRYRGFPTDAAAFKARLATLPAEFGIPVSFLEQSTMPADVFNAVEWALDNFETLQDSLVKDVALYFAVFGARFPGVVKTTVQKETSFGGKEGFGFLSKFVYGDFQEMKTAQIFRGMQKVGDIKIEWHPSNKKDVLLLTRGDLEKTGLEQGDKINLILGM